MRALTTFVSAAALAISISAASLPAHAAVFASFNPVSGNSDFRWVKSGGAGTGGHFISINSNTATVAQAVRTRFSFLDPAFNAIDNVAALLTVDATVSAGHPATFNGSSSTYTQTQLNGSFSIIYNGLDTIVGGFHLVPGENLLSGTFTDAWIQGGGTSGSFNETPGNGGAATFTSDVYNVSHLAPGTGSFAFNLLSATPKFGAGAGKALNTVRANGGGNFSAGVVPEPAAWALMIMGFGGIGAMIRRRKTIAALA
jgi:hypothetical protein